jgi:Nif-specific regulatory protein
MDIKLSILVDIHQVVSRNDDLRIALTSVLSILVERYSVKAGAVFLPVPGENMLKLSASVGYINKLAKTEFMVGEGLTGKIAETANTIVVPQLSKEPLYLNHNSAFRSKNSPEQSFIGAPIMLDHSVLGALTVNLPYSQNRDYANAKKFIQLVASALILPIHQQDVLLAQKQRLMDENIQLKNKLHAQRDFQNIIGRSAEMRDVFLQIKQVAGASATVMIRGESGTGKELIAEAIHHNSYCKEGPFIRVNCAAIPENLIESEFFGYERGAFSGAVSQKKGKFEAADGGTIFLDEVGDLTAMTQVKLLRVLQKQEFERVGGTKTIRVNVRIIAATNANLEAFINNGKMREDLYYRLNVFSIFMPPLRERKSDILLLADHFLLKYGKQQGKNIKRISTPAIDMLMRYHWPGNVRELENCIERAVLVSADNVIHSYHLPPSLQTAESSDTVAYRNLEKSVAAYEKEIIQDTLKSTKGNQRKAARLLGTTERILGYKVKKYQIPIHRFK